MKEKIIKLLKDRMLASENLASGERVQAVYEYEFEQLAEEIVGLIPDGNNVGKTIMEYRIYNHELNDELQLDINAMAKRGWVMFKSYDPEEWLDSFEHGRFIRIIWQREIKKP